MPHQSCQVCWTPQHVLDYYNSEPIKMHILKKFANFAIFGRHLQIFFRIGVLKNFAILTGKQLYWLSDLQLY